MGNTRREWVPTDLLRLEDVHKHYGDLHVLRGIDLALNAGEVMVVVGPSGSGKSTLLRCANLLEEPTQGRVWFEGEDITDVRTDLNRVRADIGIVFQAFNLFPHMSVRRNVTLALEKVLRIPKAEAAERAQLQLANVGLSEKADSYPSQLSGGQQQRVAIARALAMNPKLMLFDEVTSALDPELVQEVLDVIQKLALDGMTMMIVTHEMHFARQVATRVVFMEYGTVVADGPPGDVLDHARDERMARFLGVTTEVEEGRAWSGPSETETH
jgi:polar amino acid transport system ATP-binding protein